ncbi:MAG: trypsin-like peptidase domain-containing protein [candidate division Zixibacteria bacterium]
MNKAPKFLPNLLICLIMSGIASAQLSQGGQPLSFKYPVLKAQSAIPTESMPDFDIEYFLTEDSIEQAEGDIPFRFGAPFDVNYDLINSGIWEELPNGDRLWRLRIESPGAYSINLIYDDYWLPEGALLYLYNESRDAVIGAFINANNKDHGMFATQPVKGDVCILEYYEPAAVAGQGRISISRVVHAYKDIFKFFQAGFGGSGSCNVNINCPEGDDWKKESRAVAMVLLASGTRLCSGALVNNTHYDATPYFLTADHCLGMESTWIFMFNYESPDCTNIDGPTGMTLQGSTLRANYPPSDMALVEISEAPPEEYGVYFSGWSNLNQSSQTSVAIHHPSGDIKKISYDYDSLTSTEYGEITGESHWRVADWDIGTTEGGSSGSPLFNPEHQIVGQLHGGFAACDNDKPDWYGKFSYSWNTSSQSSEQLAYWLDPDNTGIASMTGFDPNADLNIIHTALEDTRDTINDYLINCEIISDIPINQENTLLKYSIGETPFQETMLPTGSPDEFSAIIPAQKAGTSISYYIYTEDINGNNDSTIQFEFYVDYTPEISVSVDALSETLWTGYTSQQEFNLENVGNGDIYYDLALNLFPESNPVLKKLIINNKLQAPNHNYQSEYYVVTSSKDEADLRVGYPVDKNAGGPDEYGYIWIDSDELGGPAFEWNDISSTGTDITGNLRDDNLIGPFPIGFDFSFYGIAYNQFHIGSNGLVGFDTTRLHLHYSSPIPSENTPHNFLAWLWMDLDITDFYNPEGHVYYETIDDHLIIQFTDYPMYSADPGDVVTAQVILDTSGTIIYQYLSFGGNFAANIAAVGIENSAGTDGLEVVFKNTYLKENLAIRFTPVKLWFTLNKESGTILPQESELITCTFDAIDLDPGDYQLELNVFSNDPKPENNNIIIPVNLIVTEFPYICGDANGDGYVNLGDAVFLVTFIFRSGPAPDPLESGDANCDGNADVGDAVYVINFAFKFGPKPCCPE